ncbi:MAG: hypothetical protein JXB88_14390, partial [Spirochaetales bacterium]|nr:hypothetical protein [Spirochaetales bacterium]
TDYTDFSIYFCVIGGFPFLPLNNLRSYVLLEIYTHSTMQSQVMEPAILKQELKIIIYSHLI